MTALVNVEVKVEEILTTISTVVITVSDIDIATEIIYTTTRLAAKRELEVSLPTYLPIQGRGDALKRLKRSILGIAHDGYREQRNRFGLRDSPVPLLCRINGRTLVDRVAMTATTIVVETVATEITSTISSTITALMTSFVVVPSTRTSTR